MFDGNESTCADLARIEGSTSDGSDVAFGIDFGAGKGYVFTKARALSRTKFQSRLNGAMIYGSNSKTGDWYNDSEPVSEPFTATSATPTWCEVIGVSTNRYRYLFIRQPDTTTQFWGNVMELQLWGYRPMKEGLILIVR